MHLAAIISVISAMTIVNAGVIVAPVNILEGPSTKTRLVGPDGSIIEAFAPGGKILLNQHLAAPLQAAPVVLVSSPAVAQPASVFSVNAISAEEPSAKVLAVEQISSTTTSEAASQEVTTDSLKTTDATPTSTSAASEVAPLNVVETTEREFESTTAEGDNEGQYVPDNSEKLYDDGSYKPEQN